MPFRILKIKFPKGAWRKPLFYFAFKHYDFYFKIRVEDRKKLIKEYIELMYK